MRDERTPEEWQKVDGIKVIDPDGWRNDRKPWTAPITYDEWQRRVAVSTVSGLLG